MLKGSEKQVAWAEDIIAGARGTIKANIDNIKAQQEKYNMKFRQDELEAYEKCKESLETLLAGIDSAAKIIDLRYKISGRAINEMVHEHVNVMKNKRNRVEGYKDVRVIKTKSIVINLVQ